LRASSVRLSVSAAPRKVVLIFLRLPPRIDERAEQLRRQRAKVEPNGQTNSEQRQDIAGTSDRQGGGRARTTISHAPSRL
jgi:hypothetical protein